MAPSIAVVSLLPDAGHVQPLLRVAAAFSRRGYDVVCYLPAECETYLRGSSFRFVSLDVKPPVATDEARSRTLRALSRRSIFYNAFSRYRDMSAGVWQPLARRLAPRLPFLRACLARQQPLLLLCDDHVFRPWYLRLARDLDTPIVFHTFEGYRHCQDTYVQIYGLTTVPRSLQVLVESLGWLSGRLGGVRRRLRRLAHEDLEGTLERASATLVASDDDRRPLPTPIAISTGCGYLEARHLRSRLDICHARRVFGPLRSPSAPPLSSQLRTWLAARAEPIVYVSFGSMIHVDAVLVDAILTGVTRLALRVLWSMPASQQDEVLPTVDIPPSARFETFVPPLAILTLPGVRCGINHGGAGSVQDCLLSGKPMLCIPFIWDQPFNASVISHLEAGTVLWPRQVSADTIAATVESLVYDSRFLLRASHLAAELHDSGAEADVVTYILTRPSVSARRAMASDVDVDIVAL
jgi:UDP:flavonoid glycosyltransferase YjiC (YdhE family)